VLARRHRDEQQAGRRKPKPEKEKICKQTPPATIMEPGRLRFPTWSCGWFFVWLFITLSRRQAAGFVTPPSFSSQFHNYHGFLRPGPLVSSSGARFSTTTGGTVSTTAATQEQPTKQSPQYSNFNETDWEKLTQTRRAQAEAANATILQPKALSFWTGVRFLLASAKGKAHLLLNQLRRDHGDAFMIWNQYVTISDPRAIRDVLEVYNLPKPETLLRGYRFFFPGSGGILAAPWEEWKQQRRMTNAALTMLELGETLSHNIYQAMEPLLQRLEAAATAAENGQEPRGVVEMDEAFRATTTDVIGLTIFGKSFGLGETLLEESRQRPVDADLATSKGGNKTPATSSKLYLFKSMELMTKETQKVVVLKDWMLKIFRPSKKVLQAKDYLDQFVDECIQERLGQMDVENNNGNNKQTSKTSDYITILLESYQRGTISREDVKGQLLTMLFAGYDTTAHTLSWMLYEISQNTTLQEALADEAQAVIPNRDSTLVVNRTSLLESAGPLSLMDRVFQETTRKYPAIPGGTARMVGSNPIVVNLAPGTDNNSSSFLELPAGTSISISPYAVHRHPTYWGSSSGGGGIGSDGDDDVERFDPDRFLPDAIAQRDPMAYQAFSAGPKRCVGGRLARIEAISIMSILLRRFRVTCVEEKLPPEQFMALTMKPKHGIRFSFKKRL
jgi:cytochrome P450